MIAEDKNRRPAGLMRAAVSYLVLMMLSVPLARAADEVPAGSAAPGGYGSIEPQVLYGLSAAHEKNKTFTMRTLRLSTMPVLMLAKPFKLESEYDEPIDLQGALDYALMHSLPIKIARESWVYQRGQLAGQMAGFLPSFFSNWNLNYAHISNPGATARTRVYQDIIRYPVFQGGLIVYGSLAQYYRNEAFHNNYKTTVNDSLLGAYQSYTNLVLNHALLHVRAKAVEVSRLQLELNNDMYRAGVGTAFAVMQARTQLSLDRQALLQQQNATRQSAVNLAFMLNLPMSVNLVPLDPDISEASLVDRKLSIADLIDLAIKNRPDLRLYEYFHAVGARAVQTAASGYYPVVTFLNAFTRSSTSVDPPQNARALNGVANAVVGGIVNAGAANNTQLAQTASFSPGADINGSAGANTGATTVVAASGGNPMNNIQSGNFVTSGAVAPAFGALFNNTGIAPAQNIAGGNTAGAGVFAGLNDTYQNGFNLTWTLPNLGVPYLAPIIATRALTREALHQANQELQYVAQQVHGDCLGAYVASRQIDAASSGVDSSAEALRIAQLRLNSGVGTSLELVQAQRDYVNSLVSKIQAIVASNQAQAQLLHDIGVISVSTLENGYIQ